MTCEEWWKSSEIIQVLQKNRDGGYFKGCGFVVRSRGLLINDSHMNYDTHVPAGAIVWSDRGKNNPNQFSAHPGAFEICGVIFHEDALLTFLDGCLVSFSAELYRALSTAANWCNSWTPTPWEDPEEFIEAFKRSPAGKTCGSASFQPHDGNARKKISVRAAIKHQRGNRLLEMPAKVRHREVVHGSAKIIINRGMKTHRGNRLDRRQIRPRTASRCHRTIGRTILTRSGAGKKPLGAYLHGGRKRRQSRRPLKMVKFGKRMRCRRSWP